MNVGDVLLTVILYVDKKDDLLWDSIDSIYNQTLDEKKIKILLLDATGQYYQNSKLQNYKMIEYIDCNNENFAHSHNNAMCLISSLYCMYMNSGDIITKEFVEKSTTYLRESEEYILYSYRFFAENKFEIRNCNTINCIKDIEKDPKNLPGYLNGGIFKSDLVKDILFEDSFNDYTEQVFILKCFEKVKSYIYAPSLCYTSNESNDRSVKRAMKVYEESWYIDFLENFSIPIAKRYKESLTKIPVYVQVLILLFLQRRLKENINNRNKNILLNENREIFFKLIKELLNFLDDEIIVDYKNEYKYEVEYDLRLSLLNIKYSIEQLPLNYMKYKNVLLGCINNNVIESSERIEMNISLMKLDKNVMCIHGEVNGIFHDNDIKYVAKVGSKQYSLKSYPRYAHTKVFGVSIYKKWTFKVDIPIEGDCEIQFCIMQNEKLYPLKLKYDSHFSKLSNADPMCYWKTKEYILSNRLNNAIKVEKYARYKVVLRELLLWKNLLKRKKIFYIKVVALRALYMLTKPFFVKKKIWFFLDKIYKGGDSSEYMYKYALKKKDGIKKYYVLDKNAPEYTTMKKEGYKPIKRNSIKHKLVFMNSDIVIASNSTVMAFNGFYMKLSAYFRDLFKFETACVQHGLSVQKIAIAQNRFRDNTSLYFCASHIEVENLSHYIYGYRGTDALKLTGIPRYDGLINDDKKQILISPTWRMNSAKQVSKNEGVTRDYNPLFKESDYFKVYNSLINNKKLIENSKKYGYKILYVLHPIVSPQIKDFKTNDFVQIIPSIGDTSYEVLFRESSLMVTDYSGVQFDFAYMNKPLVYYHSNLLPKHYEEGSFKYATMGFGEICEEESDLVDMLCDYMSCSCRVKPLYKQRMNDFFEFDDRNNCKRVYEELLDFRNEDS